ncbi:hypothetical protein [Nocardia yamanashiensis]|nr:hypothetical protein [Nocardia yamanashiensis]
MDPSGKTDQPQPDPAPAREAGESYREKTGEAPPEWQWKTSR